VCRTPVRLFLRLLCIWVSIVPVNPSGFRTQPNYSWFQNFGVFWMLFSFFWVIPHRLNFMCRRCETLCSIFIGGESTAYEDGTDNIFRNVRI
jgi:hypothetical protein